MNIGAGKMAIAEVTGAGALPRDAGPDPWQALAQVGAQFIAALAAANDPNAPAHPWIERDPDTGAQSLKMPLPPPETARQLANAISALADSLRGRLHNGVMGSRGGGSLLGITNPVNHYVGDAVCEEDKCRIRNNPGIMARVRSFVLNILRKNGGTNVAKALWHGALSLYHIRAGNRKIQGDSTGEVEGYRVVRRSFTAHGLPTITRRGASANHAPPAYQRHAR
jgi:hypothetical protein